MILLQFMLCGTVKGLHQPCSDNFSIYLAQRCKHTVGLWMHDLSVLQSLTCILTFHGWKQTVIRDRTSSPMWDWFAVSKAISCFADYRKRFSCCCLKEQTKWRWRVYGERAVILLFNFLWKYRNSSFYWAIYKSWTISITQIMNMHNYFRQPKETRKQGAVSGS